MEHAFDNRRISRVASPNVSTHLHRDLISDENSFHPIFVQRSTYEMKSPSSPTSMITHPSRITSTTNHHYLQRPNIPSSPLPPTTTMTTSTSTTTNNGFKMNTTYLNSAQLYISQPFEDRSRSVSSPPPPPPPRQPLNSPVVILRNQSPTTVNQRNSIMIPDFNSSPSSSSNRTQAIYRSPVPSSSSPCQENGVHEGANGSTTVGEYFGECGKCHEMVTSADDPCDVLGQIYHSSCAVCILCGRSVKNKHFYLKDHLYCEEDFLYTGFQQTLEHCFACGHSISDTIIQALGHSYHLYCFKCSKCSICLDGLPFVTDRYRNLFCLPDYHETYGLRCDKCSDPIVPEDNSNETVRIVSMGKNYHLNCYRCEDCSIQLNDDVDHRCFPLGDRLFCETCCHRRLISVHKF